MIPTLNATDFAALSPMLILLTLALVLLLIETFAEEFSKKSAVTITLIGLVIAGYATLAAPESTSPLLTPWLRFDGFAKTFTLLFLVIGFGTVLLSSAFFQRFDASRGEYFFLLISAIIGLVLIAYSADFLTLFLGLETLSISLYVLCGYMKTWQISHEAAIKYFLMGAIAAAFLLYGIALIYGATGTTNFSQLLHMYEATKGAPEHFLFMTGIALVTLGLAFKAAIVPFHTWAPDVYEGAPTPVTAFMAVGTKAGAFAAFARVFLVALPNFDPMWNELATFLAYPTLIYANMVALRQVHLRRFFAYSGISHAGFLLIPIAAGMTDSLQALVFYLAVYALATLGAFAVLATLDVRAQGVSLKDLHGLFQRSPILAGMLSLCLLTLAGIPPTAGFFAKLYVFKLAYEAGFYALLIVALLTTVLSAYYYLRIVGVMFAEAPADAPLPRYFRSATAVAVVACAAIIIVSCLPAPLLSFLAMLS